MIPVVKLVERISANATFIKTIFSGVKLDGWVIRDKNFIKMDECTYCFELAPESILLIFTTDDNIDTFSVLNISYERFKQYVSTDESLLLSAVNFSFMITYSSPNTSIQDERGTEDYDNTVEYTTSQPWIFENDGIVFDDYSESVVISNITPLFHTPSGIMIPPDIEEDEYFQLHVTYSIPAWDAFQRFKEIIPYQSSAVQNSFKVSLHYDGLVADGDVELFERSLAIIGDIICSTGS